MAKVTPNAVAEDLDAYVLVPPSAAREERPNVVLIDPGGPSPLMRFAARIRFQGDVAASIDGVRSWFHDQGREAFTWKLGAHTTPGDLEPTLRSHGAHEDKAEPEHTAMVLDQEPPGVDGIEVRLVESYEDYVLSAEILAIGFGGSFSAKERAAMREALPGRYADYRDHVTRRHYLALLDGEPAAVGIAVLTSAGVVGLGGGATLPQARGRGAYRALVRVRWDDAVRAGTPALVTQASGMSRPILERLGFRPVGPVLELIDTVG